MNIILLAGETKRARVYAQQLERIFQLEKGIEIQGVFYGQQIRNCSNSILNPETKQYFDHSDIFIPNLNEPIDDTFDRNNWHYEKVASDDVNSKELLSYLKHLTTDIIIFAGYGGQILKPDHFADGKRYLHMHPGDLPQERGSTTLFYSILKGKNCTVTSFFMTERLDDGEILIKQEYKIPDRGVDLDGWFDHVIRGDCFFKTISKYLSGELVAVNVGQMDSEEYYVIHPVLKHVALMKLK